MLKVNMLVAAVVFGLAGLFILIPFAWKEAKEHVDALRGMQYGIAAARRGGFTISRISSRNHNPNSAHAA